MKVTLIQMESTRSRQENEKKVFEFLNEAVNENSDIICLSEFFMSWGEDCSNIKVNMKDIEIYQSFAKSNNVNLVLGSVALETDIPKKTTNTCFIIDRNGNIVGRYDKKYMYTANRLDFKIDESSQVIPGKELGIAELDNIKIGVGICFDLRFPEYFRELTKKGVKIIFLPAHFRENTGKIAWETLTKARAIENQVYFCACNQTGEGLCGNTKIIDYNGTILSSLDKEEGTVTAELNLEKQDKYRKELPVLEQMK